MLKPKAFRIYDFKSIRDSGICELSGDRITVLAGQNEAGKTAILTALRDFDLEPGAIPLTKDFWPDHADDHVKPRVAVCFENDAAAGILSHLQESKLLIPRGAVSWLEATTQIWVERDLSRGEFHFDPVLEAFWHEFEIPDEQQAASEGVESEGDAGTTEDVAEAPPPSSGEKLTTLASFAAELRRLWPSFVYFDSFNNSLPRSVSVSALVPSNRKAPATKNMAEAQPSKPKTEVPQAVRDFITLSLIDVSKLSQLASDNKRIDNYLSDKTACITGDFLSYWKQTVDGDQTVELRVNARRDEEGDLQLNFFVFDSAEHYPDQRSKGFLWFLSFYLRLAAAQYRSPDHRQLLLIDEPGSYLHARAQRDVLRLLEDRLAKEDPVIYSTHSPFLIPATDLHRLRLVVKLADEGSVAINRLTDPRIRGEEFSDTLSPVLAAVGIDIREALSLTKNKNVITEGISDYFYLHAWSKILGDDFTVRCGIFPSMGAMSTTTLASLFVGWGLSFVVLLDRDDLGNAARDKLIKELGLDERRIVQPDHAAGIEDLFSPDDFKSLLKQYDEQLVPQSGESPTKFIKRAGVDKILLARRYSELSGQDGRELTAKTKESVSKLISKLKGAFEDV